MEPSGARWYPQTQPQHMHGMWNSIRTRARYGHGEAEPSPSPGDQSLPRIMTSALATFGREAHTEGDQSNEPSYPVPGASGPSGHHAQPEQQIVALARKFLE